MSTAVFPNNLRGLTWDVGVSFIGGRTSLLESASGKEYGVTAWSSPRRKFGLTYSVLDERFTTNELRDLIGFYLARLGAADTFLFEHLEDNTVAGAQIGIGDGVTTQFQLVRTFGTFVEPINAPKSVTAVMTNGVDLGGWMVDAETGVVTFSVAPSPGAVLTANFQFYFRCRFMNDYQDVNEFAYKLWEAQRVEFITRK